MPESLADAYPKQQARLRELIATYESLRGTPGVNVEFALMMLRNLQRRADEAAARGDLVAMLRCYQEMEASE